MLGSCQDVLDSMRDVLERKRVACVWCVGVGIPSSQYTAPVKGGPYKGREAICRRGAGEFLDRCMRGAGEVPTNCWIGVGEVLQRCWGYAREVLGV